MKIKNIKKQIIIIIFFFSIISILTLYSSNNILPTYLQNIYIKQFLWYILGFLIILIIQKINIKKIEKYIWIIYIILNMSLFLLLFLGTDINGAKCWFKILNTITIQPSEFMKICLIFLISDQLYKHNKSKKSDFYFILKIILILLPPCILTFKEPDTGNVIIYLVITFTILFIGGLNKKWFIISITIFIISILSFYNLYNYQKESIKFFFGNNIYLRINRIIDWKNSDGYQIEKSITSIGSSYFFGNGIKHNPIYLPEAQTDFIFTIYTSTFGFIGSFFLIFLIILFDINIIKLIKNIKYKKYKFFLSGFLGMITFQQIQNIGMTFKLFPITGITLPFISYGGSNTISLMIIIGIIIKIKNQKTNF